MRFFTCDNETPPGGRSWQKILSERAVAARGPYENLDARHGPARLGAQQARST
jgi:hypothetical protein